MRIKVYVIDVETPRWMRKVAAYGLPLAALVGIAAVVRAAPVQWGASETLTQAKMNAITVLTADAGVSYSVGPTKYCGTGPTSTTGAISYNGATGYAGAKAMCEASSGCGKSATAHMCTAEELVRSSSVGANVSTIGWYSTGTYVMDNFSTNLVSQDCQGWTYGGSAILGPGWTNGGYVGSGGQAVASGFVTVTVCSASGPVLCCD